MQSHYHTEASQPLALVSLLGLMLDSSNMGTKEVTSRAETGQAREISVREKKERDLNLVLGWEGSSSRKESLTAVFLLDHTPPSPN